MSPYGLGFWPHGLGRGRVTLPRVSGGGLKKGVTLDYRITLKPGNYIFSPAQSDAQYQLVVEG